MNEWLKFKSYEDWKENRWHPRTPISAHLIMQVEGWQRLGKTGISYRSVYKLPDGQLFEEGLGNDGACYPIDEKRLEEIHFRTE
jgi:hypothetical protein